MVFNFGVFIVDFGRLMDRNNFFLFIKNSYRTLFFSLSPFFPSFLFLFPSFFRHFILLFHSLSFFWLHKMFYYRYVLPPKQYFSGLGFGKVYKFITSWISLNKTFILGVFKRKTFGRLKSETWGAEVRALLMTRRRKWTSLLTSVKKNNNSSRIHTLFHFNRSDFVD